MHDGRLLTLEDTVEFFNIVTELNLSQKEKDALVPAETGNLASSEHPAKVSTNSAVPTRRRKSEGP